MCGIVALVRRRSQRRVPTPDEVIDGLDAALHLLGPAELDGAAERLALAAGRLEALDRTLRGVPGVMALNSRPELALAMRAKLRSLTAIADRVEAMLESSHLDLDATTLEAVNAALVRLRDANWAIERDRIAAAEATLALAGRDAGTAALEAFTSIQSALSAIDRLEVRGRDSAGLHVLVRDHGLVLDSLPVRELLAGRVDDPLFRHNAVRTPDGALAFVYKAAAEIGELGDNVRMLRSAISGDRLLHLALSTPSAQATVVGHTRWASVGIISEANAHPLNGEETDGATRPYVIGALNGDVDNHADLRATEGLQIADEITTDAKVIPSMVARQLEKGIALPAAFRRTVASFEGSVAIAAHASSEPERLLLALHGSGQALYVGLADDCYIVASEPYGVVEETSRYLRMDGDGGEIIVLDESKAGTFDGIARVGYDGSERPVTADDLTTAQITTRDIDRGDAPHFLLKEISEAPASFRKTLRGHIREHEGRLEAAVGEVALPRELVSALRSRAIKRVCVIGQGTAAVAGSSMARVLHSLVGGGSLGVEALTATEFSGFDMPADLSDTLVVAVSQSGTTTDTNRTVDLARDRGAWVVAIVNRRNSDLTDKAHGVLYTSDGRDVEMSVASTKAFYAQVAAGCLLACAIADAMGFGDADQRHELLSALRELPDAMHAVLARRSDIALAAQRFAPARRYWAVVGNGPNRVAAEEVRIKLSELCYKSIACDVTEDKKHIDLSSEPLILICAAGLAGSTADDVAKEVAIYRAHKAAPIVIASEGEERFQAALHVIAVPPVMPVLAFVLSAMAGHLFGYEAALAIDAQARPLREARAAIEHAVSTRRDSDDAEAVLERLQHALAAPFQKFSDLLRSGALDGHLDASTAVRVASLLRYGTGMVPLDLYQIEHGKIATPESVIDDLTAALTRAIEELTRPIDAIKHQAKTVTVGISRSDQGLVTNRLVREVLACGTPRDRLTYRNLKTIAELEPAVVSVNGYTRYQIEGDPGRDDATIAVVDRDGVSRGFASRVERDPALRGTKRRVATEREVTIARGRRDGRMLLIVPEVKGSDTTGITLLHVQFAERLPADTMRRVLQGYGERYGRLRDAVTETEPSFRDDLLDDMDVFELLTEPITQLAERWRSS